MKARKFFLKNNVGGFTLIELLLVILIMGILAAVVFVSVGRQRQKAKVNAALQTAGSVQAIARECYFRLNRIDFPNNNIEPTNDICNGSHSPWPKITTVGCEYDTINGTGDYYSIICNDAGQRVICGASSVNAGCEISNVP